MASSKRAKKAGGSRPTLNDFDALMFMGSSRTVVKNFQMFTHLIEFGQAGGACLVISILRQVGMGKLFHVMRTCRANRNLVVSLFCNKATASMIWTSMDLNPIVPAVTLNILPDKAEDLESFEGMSYPGKDNTDGGVHDVSVFEPVQLDPKLKIPFRFLDHGDVSLDLDLSKLNDLFNSNGIEVYSYEFYGISPARGVLSSDVVLTLDSCLQIESFNAENAGARLLLATDSEIPSRYSICKIQLTVTVARVSPTHVSILAVEPVLGSMKRCTDGICYRIDSLPGRDHYMTKTVKWGWFKESVREMLAGSPIPAETRIVLAYTPLGNLIGNGFADFEVGTVAVLTVAQSARKDDFSTQGVVDAPQTKTSFLVYIRGHKPNGRIHIQVLRYENACWVACMIYGRPVIISCSEKKASIHFMGISDNSDHKILGTEERALVNALVRSDFKSNWYNVVVPAVTSRTRDSNSLLAVLMSKEGMDGLLEMVLFDAPSVWSLFEDCKFDRMCVRNFALQCVRLDDDRHRSFASKLIQTDVGLQSFVDMIISLVGTSVDVDDIAVLMGRHGSDTSSSHFQSCMHLFMGYKVGKFSVTCDDAEFDRLFTCLQRCCPQTVFPLACTLMASDTLSQATAQRIARLLRWSFDKYPGINRAYINLDKCTELAFKVFDKNKELCKVWNDHFNVIDMDMDELSRELVTATPSFAKFLKRFEKIRTQLPGVKAMVAKMQAIAAKRDAATDGGGGSAKSGLKADLGTVRYGTKGASMSVNVLGELVDQLTALSKEFTPVDAPRAALVALVTGDGGQGADDDDDEDDM